MSRRGTLTLRREDGRIVCERVVVADKTFRRMRGLLGRGSLPPGEGITLRPAWSIHTGFMRFPIDVVFVDQDLVVLRIDADLRPFRTASCRGAREVVELSAGECARRGLTVGDRVAWASHTAAIGTPAAAPATPQEAEIRGRVILASRDARFVKLTRFLLYGRGIDAETTVQADKLSLAVEQETDVDAVILDAQDGVAQALVTANAARALRPDVPILIVGETEASERAPLGARVYDKWDETDELLAALEQILDEHQVDPLTPPLLGYDA